MFKYSAAFGFPSLISRWVVKLDGMPGGDEVSESALKKKRVNPSTKKSRNSKKKQVEQLKEIKTSSREKFGSHWCAKTNLRNSARKIHHKIIKPPGAFRKV